mmetsp:Transcript_38469/g.90464  ORF Transcript_38469/g.90464 Transcript_38469/m.90464 type:complete len:181 (+) Transcript_38469:77-619(+)
MSMSTIEFTGGVVSTTSRLWLKREMERFGEVDVCHMGNRDNPVEEPPWVRFKDSQAAEKALEAIKNSQVVLDGNVLEAEWKANRRGGGGGFPRDAVSRRDLEVNSRDLFLEQERARVRGGDRGGGGGGGNRGGDRGGDRGRGGRSRSRGRRRDDSRDRGRRSRSRDRGRRSRSRDRDRRR